MNKDHLVVNSAILKRLQQSVNYNIQQILVIQQETAEHHSDSSIQETRQYQEVLRKEVKANAEKKMDKVLAWQQFNNISHRVEYLEHHLGDKHE